MAVDCRRRDAHATIILYGLGGPEEVLDIFVDISSGARDIVALIRDLIVIGTALFVLIAGFLVYRKLSSVLDSIDNTLKSTQDVASAIADRFTEPEDSGTGFLYGIGKILVSLVRGLRVP